MSTGKLEFLSQIKSHGAILMPPATDRALVLAQNALQQMKSAMMPRAFIDLLHNDADGIILGDANIFGANEYDRPGAMYTIPGIVQVNREINGIPSMRGRTIFGRNGLFWFCFDAYGYCYMLDILTLNPMRKYEDPFRAMTDCLVVGRV